MKLAPQELRTYFVTSVTAQRRRLFQVEANANLLIDVLRDCRIKQRMEVHAFVVMPDHFHAVITPASDVSLEKAMQFIKGGFSFRLKSKMDTWERGYNETRVKDRAMFDEFVRYVETNPVRKGYVESPELWEFSSARIDVDPRPSWLG